MLLRRTLVCPLGAHCVGYVANHRPVRAGFAGGGNSGPHELNTALAVGESALLLKDARSG